jgi:glucose-6-phosphate isomerase
MDPTSLWQRYQTYLCECPLPGMGLALDISRMDFDEGFFDRMSGPIAKAYDAMDSLEKGAIANPDEDRMVGHYWLRAPALAPQPELRREIEGTVARVKAFARDVHHGAVAPPSGDRFTDLLVIGIGGSALGPQLVADALSSADDPLTPHFLDNTDPDGIARTLGAIGPRLKSTLAVVISKSGSTPETRNGMVEAEAAFAAAGLDFAKQAVAVTGEGSTLDRRADNHGWLARFPMWDWVGGRTSVTSAVGLLPAALQGIDIDALLQGAAAMDQVTRKHDTSENPAALLALMWRHATGGRGEKDMVILPYKDRLVLLSRYLQQLIMESLGKEKDLDGKVVHQGIAVYGNKGSTDQHAYVQQLREGVNNFFATFIVVLEDGGPGNSQGATHVEVEPGVTCGDYLNGFWQGTRQALYENGRGSITITVQALNTRTLGALIALYERAVGFYATLVHINAYHQPGVEAGKKAAAAVLDLQRKVVAQLQQSKGPIKPEQVAGPDHAEAVHHILQHLAANGRA